MRRAILADTDAVVREDVRHWQAHQGSQADHRLRVVTEDEERRDIGAQAAVEHQAIGNRGHGELADAEMQVAARIVELAEVPLAFHMRLVRRCEVSTAADEVRHDVLEAVDHLAGEIARCDSLVLISPELIVVVERLGIDSRVVLLPASLVLRELLAVLSEHLVPGRLCLLALLGEVCIVIVDILRDVERLLRFRPAEVLLHSLNVLLAERLAVSAGLALLGRAAVADLRLDRDEGWMLLVSLRFFDGLADGLEIIAVLDCDCLEPKGAHTSLDILREGDIRVALDGDLVGIVEDDELREAKRASERERLRGDAFHHAAVAAERERVVVDNRVARAVEHRSEVCLCHRHADSHAHACAERARRGFDADRVAVLRMARCQRAHLAELFHIIHRQAIAVEMEQRIKQRRTVAARQDEAVTIGPFRILGIVVHVICPELIRHRGAAERQARMTGFCLLDCICCENADRIHAFRIDVTQSVSLLTT